jgi:putative transposase
MAETKILPEKVGVDETLVNARKNGIGGLIDVPVTTLMDLNAALRLQLRAFQRTRRRPVLTASDRLFWCALAKVWSGWRGALMFVQPETVVRWQRERFRRFWASLSKQTGIKRGRPSIPAEIRRLIVQMAVENPLWRALRIDGE